jgi:hypothetical protein
MGFLVNRGLSGPDGQTVRRYFFFPVSRDAETMWLKVFERRTVRPWGADCPPVIF